jgi:peptide deformylase
MAVLEIRKYPDEVLKKKAEPVEAVDEALQRLMDDMVETMYAAPGVGLAAPQVGVSKRIIVADVSHLEGEAASLVVLVNPEIIESHGSVKTEEGCLSLPEFLTTVERAETVTVKGLDREGREVTMPVEGLLAVALQHEIDHLDGTLILDRASFLKREFYKKQLRKNLAKAKAG